MTKQSNIFDLDIILLIVNTRAIDYIFKDNNFYSKYTFVTPNDWKQIQNIEVFDRNIIVDDLVIVNIYLNNFSIFVYRVLIKLLLLSFLLTRNNKSFFISITDINLIYNHTKYAGFLLFSFNVGFTNDIDFKISILGTISLRKIQITGFDSVKSAINVVT